MFSSIQLAKFKLSLKPVSLLHLPPYKGSTLRGGFGHAFKRVVCVDRQQTCLQCYLRQQCIYAYIFETPPPKDSAIMKKYPYAPHPFVIEPPLAEQREYTPTDTLTFGLILVGKAIDYLPYFIYTFQELGKQGIGKGRGKYQLAEVSFADVDGSEGVVYQAESQTVHDNYPIWGAAQLEQIAGQLSPTQITLDFITPTRIRYHEDLVLDLEFHILIRTLLRRISTIFYFHLGQELSLDFKGLIQKAQQVKTAEHSLYWYDWQRYSQRQQTRMKLGGFKGKISFAGDLSAFLPLIALGSWLHVGKGTSFGLGGYRIVG